MSKIIAAAFPDKNFRYVKVTEKIWKYDYGITLRLYGLELPTAVEVQFSELEKSGSVETRIGVTKDGVTDVQIPDNLLRLEKTQDYNIYAFVYVADETSGCTEYKMRMTVKARPEPEVLDEDEVHLFDEAIAAVNNAADRAETAAEEASDSASAAKVAAETTSKDLVEVKKTAGEVAEDAKQAASDRQAAGEYAELAKQVATKNGFCQLQVDGSGHLILTRTENIVDLLDFALTKNGHLEVIASEN